MKKTLYKKELIEATAENSAMTLKYFLLESEIEIDSATLRCYGVEIKKTALEGTKELSEVKQIKNTFFDKSEALCFLDMLARNTVTPMSLSSVLEDYIQDAIHSRKRLPVLI